MEKKSCPTRSSRFLDCYGTVTTNLFHQPRCCRGAELVQETVTAEAIRPDSGYGTRTLSDSQFIEFIHSDSHFPDYSAQRPDGDITWMSWHGYGDVLLFEVKDWMSFCADFDVSCASQF